MAAEGKAIVFYRGSLFIFYFVSIDERPVVGSRPNLVSRLEVVSIYKCPQNFGGPFPKFGVQKNINFGPFFVSSALDTAYL